jgi:hypothetical protein
VATLDGPANPFAVLAAREAATYAGVTVAAVGNWRTRGYINPATGKREFLPVATGDQGQEIRDDHGRPKYRLVDVAKAEYATSRRARRAAA